VGPLPKRKLSKTRKRTRRNHDTLSLSHLVECEKCGSYRLAHHVCKECGTYKGEQVVAIKEEKKD
jgi:large subunit ribosomal protein L32